MENNFNHPSNTELNKIDNVESSKSKKWFLITSVVAVLVVLGAGLFMSGIFSKDEVTKTEAYRFVNNNSALCTHDAEQIRIECINLQYNQVQAITIPNEFKDLTSIQPSHDGTKLLISLNPDPESTKFMVTDTNFTNPIDITVPYSLEGGVNPYPEIIWGSNSDKLLISQQVREENDSDFLPAPLVVWDYNVATKETRRIYKNGDNEEPAIKLVGASDEYLFITQPVYKNWVAKDTDPPADALLAVRLDDGFVRVVNIEKIVKFNDRNKYASGLSISYDPSVSTFYLGGQDQASDTDYQNFYVAAKLVDNNGLEVEELSRLTSTNQEQYHGISSTAGTLVADWSDELEVSEYSFVASSEEKYIIQDVNSDKDTTIFTIASLPNAE